MSNNYTSISVPKELSKEISDLVKNNPTYGSKADFIREALRIHIYKVRDQGSK